MKDNLYIEIHDNNDRILKIQIVRIKENIWNDYLDIIVESTGENNRKFDKYHHGIMGHVWNRSYKFLNHPKINKQSVLINGKIINSFKTKRSFTSLYCYSINLSDILHPKKLSSFRRFI